MNVAVGHSAKAAVRKRKPLRFGILATQVGLLVLLLGTWQFAVSDANGVYSLQGLPPGSYTVSFVLSGFQSATREAIAERSTTIGLSLPRSIAGTLNT